MKILVIGNGGREHALVWKLAQSQQVERVFCAPGNAGIASLAECVDIQADDVEKLAEFAKNNKIDITVVGPEVALVAGVVDVFERHGLKIFGPSKLAAQLEGSKSFAKLFMQKYNIPTSNYGIFTNAGEAKAFVKAHGLPCVVKADGLAAGKGAIICRTEADAGFAIDSMLKHNEFGAAGSRVIVEEFLEGEEVSFICISDGTTVIPLATSRDHKPVYDGDEGPNTGGMGAYSPVPSVDDDMSRKIMKEIMEPAISGMAMEGRPFVGFLYAGVMISSGIPRVLEFNARLGDPEAQPLMVRLRSDLAELIEAALSQRLKDVVLRWDDCASACVVMASRGYPGNYIKGCEINGIEDAAAMKGVVIFHSGTAMKDGVLVTDGGRVLSVTALGVKLDEAVENVYKAVDKISWDGVLYRKDIGRRMK